MKKNKIIIASTTLLLATILMSSNNASTKIFKYFNLGSNKELTTGIESLHIQAPKLPSSISFAGEQIFF
jgi:hypothetical protein